MVSEVLGCARAELGERLKQSIGESRNPYFSSQLQSRIQVRGAVLRVCK